MINIIKLVKSLLAFDGNIFQIVRCRFLGRDQDFKVLNLYGHSFNPPKNSFGVAFSANGNNSDIHVIVDKPELRFTGLAEGEVKSGNTLLGETVPANKTYIYFKADGTIEIKSNSTVNIIGNVVVEGTVTASNFITGTVADYNAHTHSGVDTGIGNTGGPS